MRFASEQPHDIRRAIHSQVRNPSGSATSCSCDTTVPHSKASACAVCGPPQRGLPDNHTFNNFSVQRINPRAKPISSQTPSARRDLPRHTTHPLGVSTLNYHEVFTYHNIST